MSYTLDLTGEQINSTLNGRYYNPIEDIVGDNYSSGSPLSMSASTEYDFVCNGNTRLYQNFPSHITHIWNTSTNIAVFDEFLDTPEMVANVSFYWSPASANAGTIIVDCYVNETVPILIKEAIVNYKATAGKITAIITFYAGDTAGFDVKNKGVFFKITPSSAGDFYDPSLEIYRT